MEINTDDVVNQCLKAIKNKVKNLCNLNVMVIGKSGVGKSTLINTVFRGNFAETGVGKPVTKDIRRIDKQDYPLSIYDTPGFELGKDQQDTVKEEILDIIRKGALSRDINKLIHCIWYCVNVGGNRTFDDEELKWIRDFSRSNVENHVPIIIVLTQAVPKIKAAEMKTLIEKENLEIIKIVPVLAQDMDFDGEYIAHAYGLDRLIDVMSAALPAELQDSIQNMQKVSLEAKKKYSQTAVAAAVATSFGEGCAPIPFSDAALLVPTQVAMLAGITVIFGIDVDKSFLTCLVSSTIGSGGATILGKTFVSNVLKLIPGVGTVVGGAISGATASLITTALGEAYIQLMVMIYKGELKKEDLTGDKGKETMFTLFKTQLKNSK